MLTSASFIVINSIRAVCFNKNSVRVVNESCSDKRSSPASYVQNDGPLDVVSSGLISEFARCLDSKPMQFHCRVSLILSCFSLRLNLVSPFLLFTIEFLDG